MYKVIFSLILISSFINAKEKVTWFSVNFPPFMIKDGKYKGEGIDDIIMKESIELTSNNYSHKVDFVAFSKMFELLKQDKLYCTTALIKTEEREKYITFSKPVSVGLSNRLFVYKKSLNKIKPFIDDDGFVDLKKLLEQDNFKLGLTKLRMYGKTIDKIIDNSQTIYRRTGEDLAEGILKMVISNRGIDATIAYPLEVDYLSKKTKIDFMNHLVQIPIRNNKQMVEARIGCSKNKKGAEFINYINKEIIQIRKAAFKIESFWNTDKNMQKLKQNWNSLLTNN